MLTVQYGVLITLHGLLIVRHGGAYPHIWRETESSLASAAAWSRPTNAWLHKSERDAHPLPLCRFRCLSASVSVRAVRRVLCGAWDESRCRVW